MEKKMESNYLLSEVQKQLLRIEQTRREGSTWRSWYDQDVYDLLKQIEKDLLNTRNG